MEDPGKEQNQSSALTANDGKSKLRYPLRSSTTKLKPEKSPPTDNSVSSSKRARASSSVSKSVNVLNLSANDKSTTKLKPEKSPSTDNSVSSYKRARASSSVSKSVNVLNLSANDKSAKPPRRLSIPAKPIVVTRPKPIGNVTPVSETRVKSDPSFSDVSKSSTRRKFNALSSASYWLSQIKLSESVPNHSVSLGFFKLAVEAGCEPLQRLCDELKSYVLKHNVIQLEETVKNVFEIYGISETLEQLQVSETCSHVPEEGTLSPVGARSLKSKSLNAEACEVSSGKESVNASKTTAASRLQGSSLRKSATPKLTSENGTQNLGRKARKVGKQFPSNGQDKIMQKKKTAGKAPTKTPEIEEVVYENKENLDAAAVDEIREGH